MGRKPAKQNSIRTRDGQEKQMLIKKAALAELAERGFAGARTESIARKAGTSVGTLFKYFGTKRALANTIYLECLQRVAERIAPALQQPAPAALAFGQMWQGYTDLFFHDPDCLIFFEIQMHDSFLDEKSRQARARLRAGLREWIVHWQKQGVILDVDPEYLRALVIGGFLRLVREAKDRNFQPTREHFAEFSRVCWAAIGKK